MDFWARKKIKQSHLTMENHRKYVQMSFSERIVAGTIFGYDWFSLIGGIGN
jgi:hypothetical protein